MDSLGQGSRKCFAGWSQLAVRGVGGAGGLSQLQMDGDYSQGGEGLEKPDGSRYLILLETPGLSVWSVHGS